MPQQNSPTTILTRHFKLWCQWKNLSCSLWEWGKFLFSFKQGEWLKYVQEWYNQSCLFKFWFCILMVKKKPDLNSEYKHFWRICSGNIVWEENTGYLLHNVMVCISMYVLDINHYSLTYFIYCFQNVGGITKKRKN